MADLSLDDLVANRTMSREIAVSLRAAAREKCSFLVFARPRLAGKSTVVAALLREVPPKTAVRVLGDDGLDVEKLAAEARGGYLIVPEVSRYAVSPGYVWGEPVRRAFQSMAASCSLAAALHADAASDALDIVHEGNGVPIEDVAHLVVLVHLRSLGDDWRNPVRRVVAEVHEIEGVRGGKIALRLLHRWDEKADRFERVAAPTRFGR